jgi:hypothetical protein
MKRLLSTVAVLCALSVPMSAASYSKALDFRPSTPEELAMTSVPFAPGAPAVILDWARVDDDTTGLSSEYFRIKVFSEEGKKYGDVEVPYFPGYPLMGRVSEIEARTIQPDGKIVPFSGKVYDKVLFKTGRRAVRAKTFSVQDIQPGSIIEYRYTNRWERNYLLDTTWSIQRDIPVLHAKFSLRAYDPKLGSEFNTLFTYVGLPAGKLPAKNGDRWELELENIAAFQHEQFAPPEDELKARVKFYYTRSRVKPEAFWPIEADSIAKTVQTFVGKKAMDASAWTAGATTPLDKLRKIYARVQSMRNLSFEVEKSEQELAQQAIKEAKNAGDVLQNNAGTRDDLNRLFVAMARGAGFDADVLRVPTRDSTFFTDKIPDGGQMSAEVVLVTLDGKPLFLDPGTPYAPFGTVSWEKSNVPAIRVGKDGKPQWTKVEGAFPADARMRRNADLKMKGETLSGTVTATFTGQEALVRRLRLHGEDEAARKKALEDEAKGWFAEGSSVTLESVTGHQSSDDTLVATFEVSMPNAISRAGSRLVLPISIFAATAANPFAPATRTHPIYFDYPSSEEDSVRITLGPGVKVSTLPPPSKLNAGALTYASETAATATEVTFKRTLTVDAMLVEQKYYQGLRKFYTAVLSADQKPVLLTETAQ